MFINIGLVNSSIINQKQLKNRLIITIPIFVIIVGLSIWDFTDQTNFNILWRWFSWSNQVISSFALWIETLYLLKDGKYKFGFLITAIPATFMSIVTLTYILGEPNIAFEGSYQ